MTIYDEEMKRRRINQALLQNSLSQNRVNQVSGRVVPYDPFEGLTQLGKAYIARRNREKGEEMARLREEEERQRTQDTAQNVIDLLKGKPKTSYQLGESESFEGEQIPGLYNAPVKPDPISAMVTASTDPNLRGLTGIINSMQRSPYSRLVPTTQGWMSHNVRTNEITPAQLEGETLQPPQYSPERQQELAASKASGKIEGEAKSTAELDLPQTEYSASETIKLVDDLVDHPGMKDVIGFPDNPLVLKGLVPGTDAADFRSRLDQITGRTFMEIFPTLKGGGQITEIEGEKGQESINRMGTSTSEKEFKKAASDFKSEVNRLREIVRNRAGVQGGYIETRVTPDGRKLGKKADGTIEVIQ